MSKIKNLIIHCSDSNWGDVKIIREWHLARGWRDIGYNLVILNGKRSAGSSGYNANDNGLIELGRGLDFSPIIEADERGAHARGYNHNSIGVCMIGKKSFTSKQFESLAAFCKVWKNIIPELNIIGHYQCDDTTKTCPNFDVDLFLKINGLSY